jgi:alpha-beta hydrolase superfamily lysophospholipase
VFRPLADAGITIVAPDHRGHGKTAELNPGTIGNTQFELLHKDAMGILEQEANEVGYGDIPLIIAGHSLGGLISMRFVYKYANQLPNFKGVLVSAPALGVFLNFITRGVLYSLSMVAPNFVVCLLYQTTNFGRFLLPLTRVQSAKTPVSWKFTTMTQWFTIVSL